MKIMLLRTTSQINNYEKYCIFNITCFILDYDTPVAVPCLLT